MKTIFGWLVPVLFTFYLINVYQSANVHYTLSDSVPVEFLSQDSKETKNAEFAQILTIKNYGRKTSNEIKVKINREISKYVLNKNSESDKVKIYTNNGFELDYDSLPPEAGFNLILKVALQPLNDSDVVISDDKGLVNKFSANYDIDKIIGLIGALVYCFFGLLSFVSFLKSTKIGDLKYKTVLEILETKKPIYISKEKWNEGLKDIFDYKLRPTHFRDPRNSDGYTLLNSEKPNGWDVSVWQSLIGCSQNGLKEDFMCKVNSSFYAEDLIPILKLAKPKYYDEDGWLNLKKEASKQYVKLLNRNALFSRLDDYQSVLRQVKPDGVLEDDWNGYISEIKEKYGRLVEERIGYSKEPLGYLDSIQVDSFLEKKAVDSLKSYAYSKQLRKIPSLLSYANAKKFLSDGKPSWMQQDDFNELKKISEDVIKFERADKLQHLLRLILQNGSFPESKPEELLNEEWDAVIKIKNEILKMREEFKSVEILSGEKREFTALKSKVEKQLSIIDGLIKDPSSLTKVEEYGQPFAAGNFENLRKIADLLKKI